MSGRRVQKSPHSRLRLPWHARRAFGALLLLACLPSLLLNVGTGRGVLFHEHESASLHTHVVSASFEHGHTHGHAEANADTGIAAGTDGTLAPLEHHHDGAVIRGTEVAASRKHDPSKGVFSFEAQPVALVLLAAMTPAFTPVAIAPRDLTAGTRHTELACLRAVVLLI